MNLTDTEGIRAVFLSYVVAWQKLSPSACAGCFTSDGIMLDAWGHRSEGYEAIRARHAQWVEFGVRKFNVTLEEIEVSGSNAKCNTRFSAEYDHGDELVRLEGQGRNSLRRCKDGLWRFERKDIQLLSEIRTSHDANTEMHLSR